MRQLHDLRHSINMLWERLPNELRNGPEAALLNEFRCVITMDIVQLIYRPDRALGQSKDYEFDRPTMETRWAQGLKDAQQTIIAAPWLEPMPPELGARTFDVCAKGPIGDASTISSNTTSQHVDAPRTKA